MNNSRNVKINPFLIFCQKVIPLAFDESLSYYECLCGLMNFLKDEVIPAVNNNADAVTELQNLYVELKNYVDTYFDNLDIQTEVNNKLDEMAESGQLADIIAQYLEVASVLGFNTIADLHNADNLNNGSFTRTFGSNSYNDGDGAFYKIRQITSSDVVDEYNIVSLINYPSLIAERMKVKDIGNLENLQTIDKSSLVNAVNSAYNEATTGIQYVYDYASTKMGEYQTYKNQSYYFVDGSNGNDNNDGLTSETPFKTLDKALSFLNTSSSDCRIRIISAGSYNLTKTQFSNANIHIVGDVSGVIITNSGSELVFYGGHLNAQNITWNIVGNYFDNCLVGFDGCVIVNYTRFYGGGVVITNSTVNMLRFSWTKAVVSNITIDNQDKTLSPLHCDSSTDLTLLDNLTLQHLSNPTTYGVIGVYRATIYFIATVVNNTQLNDYNYGFLVNHAIIDTTNTLLNGIGNVGTNGNQLNHCLYFTNTQSLPIV